VTQGGKGGYSEGAEKFSTPLGGRHIFEEFEKKKKKNKTKTKVIAIT